MYIGVYHKKEANEFRQIRKAVGMTQRPSRKIQVGWLVVEYYGKNSTFKGMYYLSKIGFIFAPDNNEQNHLIWDDSGKDDKLSELMYLVQISPCGRKPGDIYEVQRINIGKNLLLKIKTNIICMPSIIDKETMMLGLNHIYLGGDDD